MPFSVFISYRRKGASELAQLLYSRLHADGYAPFFDIETMRSGKFNKQLYDRIDECQDVLLILPPHALDPRDTEEDWVRMEIAYALEKGKNIVPVMMRNFDWPKKETLPEDIRPVCDYHGVSADMEYFEAVYERIKKLLHTKPSEIEPEVTNAGIVTKQLVIADLMLENGEFEKAEEQAKNILGKDPECALAYLILFMTDHKLHNREELRTYYGQNLVYEDFNLKLAEKYADEQLQTYLQTLTPPQCPRHSVIATTQCEGCGALVCEDCVEEIPASTLEPATWPEGKRLCPDCVDSLRQDMDEMRKNNIHAIVFSFLSIPLTLIIAFVIWKIWDPHFLLALLIACAVTWTVRLISKENLGADNPDDVGGLFAWLLYLVIQLVSLPMRLPWKIGRSIYWIVKMKNLMKPVPGTVEDSEYQAQVLINYYKMVHITRKLKEKEPKRKKEGE